MVVDVVAPPLSLDDASQAELAALDHVDDTLAERIVVVRGERGGHLQSVDELPADYRGMLRRRHPDVLEDIEGVFADTPASGH